MKLIRADNPTGEGRITLEGGKRKTGPESGMSDPKVYQGKTGDRSRDWPYVAGLRKEI